MRMSSSSTTSIYENEISKWREIFLQQNDDYFLKIMRLYLGEVKTPYNKQKLILQLEGFLRREETQKNIVALLSEEDTQILCVIKFLPASTKETLSDFFSKDFNSKKFEARLKELRARLLIYEDSTNSYNSIYKINPLLKDALNKVLKIERLFPEYKSPESSADNSALRSSVARQESHECITVELVGAFLNYIAKNKKICKQDGSFKKLTEEDLKEKFPGKIEMLRLLPRAFLNLGIVKENEGSFEINWQKIEQLSKIENHEQLIYLLVAIPAYSTRDTVRYYAEIFLRTLKMIPNGGFSKNVFLRHVNFMVAKNSGGGYSYFGTSRFARILQSHSENNSSEQEPKTLIEFFERLLDFAATLGIVKAVSVSSDENDKDEKNAEKVIFKNEKFSMKNPSIEGAMINIDSAFNIMLMQGFAFNKILQVVKFADIVKFDTVSQFEITRESANRAFDSGMNVEGILSFIKENSGFAVPDSLEISIKEWETLYNSVKVFKGYVVQFDEKTAAVAEKKSLFRERIFERLTPTIFLLNCKNDIEVRVLLTRCGIEKPGKIKSTEDAAESSGFAALENSRAFFDNDLYEDEDSSKNNAPFAENNSGNSDSNDAQPANSEQAMQLLYKQIDALELSTEQKNTLRDIAASKIIVNSSQLCAPAIPVERNSAQGMDYQGKVRIIEQAIRNKEEILFRLSMEANLQTGLPTGMDRTNFNDGSYVNVTVGNSKKKYSVGKIEFVQRLHKLSVLE